MLLKVQDKLFLVKLKALPLETVEPFLRIPIRIQEQDMSENPFLEISVLVLELRIAVQGRSWGSKESICLFLQFSSIQIW